MKQAFRKILGTGMCAFLLFGCAADRLHRDGLKDIENGNYESGVSELAQAVQHEPDNMTYKVDLEARREASIQKLIGEGDADRTAGKLDAAAATFRRVLSIESSNQRALRGIEGVESDRRHAATVADAAKDFEHRDYDTAEAKLHGVLAEDSGYTAALNLSAKINTARGPVTVAPHLKTRNNAKVTLQFRDAPTKMVFEVLARQTGINFILDKDIKSDGKTTIFVQDVAVDEAIDLVLDQNALARQILSPNMVLIYPNTATKQKDYEEQIVHTFYLTNAVPKDVEGMLKSMLGAKNLFVDERTNVIVMRDTPDSVRMAEKLVASIDVPEPEVIIEMEVLEIERSKVLNLGLSYPGSVTFTANPVNGSATASKAGSLVVNDLSNQNKNTIGVSSLSATLSAMQQNGTSNTLASPRIRARNKEKAKILIGSRQPIITSNTTLIGGGSAANSSVQYLDIGLTLEVQPTIYLDGDVAIKVALEVSNITGSVTGGSGTTAPIVGTRNANTLLRLKDGETQILAGLIQDSDTRNQSGLPGLSQIPILGRLFGSNSTDRQKNEIVLSITPRIIRTQARPSSDTSEFWYGTETRTRSMPHRAEGDSAPASGATQGGGQGATNTGAPVNPTSAMNSAAGGGVSGGGVVGTTGGGTAAGMNTPRLAPGAGMTPVPRIAPAGAAAAEGPAAHPVVTLVGPSDASVGQEFDVTVHLASDVGMTRVRGQVRFDPSALQLMGATPGDLVPASAGSPNVDAKSGGAQLEVVATEDPVQGEGSLMVLRFKALTARAASSIAAQVSAVGSSGTASANASSPPLSVAIKP